MVATVLKLRYRILGNTLLRSPWQMIGFILGTFWALSLVVMLVIGVIALSIFQGVDVARVAIVIGGSLLLLGWLIGPLIVSGMDTSVDETKLAPFPLTTRQVMIALTATGVTGVPGIITTLAAVSTVILWFRWPVAAIVAVPCVALAVLTCILASRLMGALATTSGGGRVQQIVGTIALVALIFTGPILTAITSLAAGTVDLAQRLEQIAGGLAWTPLGAAWAVPGDIAAQEWLPALARLAIAIATPLVLWWLWARALRVATTSPRRRTVRVARKGALGFFGRMPTGPVGATWARSLTSWTRDPRYLRQLLMVPLFPILFALLGGLDSPMFLLAPILVALVLAIVGYTDISYDGTAFALVLSSGISGRADRLGRLLGAACVGVPLMIVISIVVTAVADRLHDLPALLGGSVGIVLVGYGVSAVSSAYIVSPVPSPGDNPFRSVPGQTFVNSLLAFVVWGAVLVLALPFAIPGVIAIFTRNDVLGWIVLAAGLVIGVAVSVAGIFLGGRALDRTGPALLTRMKAFPR